MLETVYLICAAFGGTILAIQIVMSLFGFGFDGDIDADLGTDTDMGMNGDAHAGVAHSHQALILFRVLSFRTIIAGCTFFGLGGLAGLSGGAVLCRGR